MSCSFFTSVEGTKLQRTWSQLSYSYPLSHIWTLSTCISYIFFFNYMKLHCYRHGIKTDIRYFFIGQALRATSVVFLFNWDINVYNLTLMKAYGWFGWIVSKEQILALIFLGLYKSQQFCLIEILIYINIENSHKLTYGRISEIINILLFLCQ